MGGLQAVTARANAGSVSANTASFLGAIVPTFDQELRVDILCNERSFTYMNVQKRDVMF